MKRTVLATAILSSLLVTSAYAEYPVYGGSLSGDYYGMASKTAPQLKAALEKEWVTDNVKAETTTGSPVIITNVCDNPKASGFTQGNLALPECATIAAPKVANEIVFAVVNPWIANKVSGYESNRLAVWQAIVKFKDKVTFYTRTGSGHKATYDQLSEISSLPAGTDGGSSNVQILNAIKKNQASVSVFTQFARPDSKLFKDIEKLGLVVVPIMTPEMKDFSLNDQRVYSVCPDAKVSSSLFSKSVTITTACVGANFIVNANASEEMKKAIGTIDFSKVTPKEGIFSKLKSKVGSQAAGAKSQLTGLIEKASSQVENIKF